MAQGVPGEGRELHVRRRSCDRVAFLWGLAADQAGLGGGGGCPGEPGLPSPSSRTASSGPRWFPSPISLMHEGVAAAEEGSRFSLLSTHLQGVAALGGSFPFRPLSAQGFYPPPGKVAPARLPAPPERGSRERSWQCRPLGAKALCSELSSRGLRSGSYWNSRFERCPNDLIKAAEENAQAMRSCSSDEEVLAILVLLCRGTGGGANGKIFQVFMALSFLNRKSGSLFFVCY